MSKDPRTAKAIFHTAVLKETRKYLMQLAAAPELTKSGTLQELLSFAAIHFLASKPFEAANWQWKRPEGYYTKVGGKLEKNGDWVPVNIQFCDVKLPNDEWKKAEVIGNDLTSLAATNVPKISRRDTGSSTLFHNFLLWVAEDLYPAGKFKGPQIVAPKLEYAY